MDDCRGAKKRTLCARLILSLCVLRHCIDFVFAGAFVFLRIFWMGQWTKSREKPKTSRERKRRWGVKDVGGMAKGRGWRIVRPAGLWVWMAFWGVGLHAQVTPPALDGAWGSWVAVAIRQKTDSSGRGRLWAYLGVGRTAAAQSARLFQRQAIFVSCAEYFRRFHPNLQYSAAFTHRIQNVYAKAFRHGGFFYEYRLYGRFAYVYESHRVQLGLGFRQELRFFTAPDLSVEGEALQPRSRLRAEAAVYVDPKSFHRLSFRVEQLAALSFFTDRQPNRFRMRDARISFHYTYHRPKFSVGVGAMTVWFPADEEWRMIMGLDWTFVDPFMPGGKSKKKPKRPLPSTREQWEEAP